ncbi:MAG: ECF-type sigma factor [Planctomycetaceae bacterium]
MGDEINPTTWLGLLKAGDSQAAQRLWEAYFERLVGLAQRKLSGIPTRAFDGEDIALAAFDSFYRGVRKGHFPELNDRNDLWQILVMLTARKAIDQKLHERRDKRGGGHVRGESAFDGRDDLQRGIERVIASDPTPEFAAEVAEEFRTLLQQLGDDDLRRLAVAKFEGHSNEEIARQRGISVRSVERKLAVIRGLWKEKLR